MPPTSTSSTRSVEARSPTPAWLISLDNAALTVDFDADGRRVLGIEVLGASRVLRPETIQAAEDITGRHH
jgi:hypothetical protein